MSERCRYVLLCRHAAHDDGELVPVKGDDDRWRFPTESVASVLAEELVLGRDRLRLAKLVHAPTPEASRTAWLLAQRLAGATRIVDDERPSLPVDMSTCNRVEIVAPAWLPAAVRQHRAEVGACGYEVTCERWDQLLPNHLQRTRREAVKCIEEELDALGDGRNTLLVVGHQPQMGWISGYLSADRRLGGGNGAVPFSPSEVVCLRLKPTRQGWRGSLAWTLTPDDSKALAAVSDKVKGKMESAKLLSAVITLALTALLGALLDTTRWARLGEPRAALAGLSYSGRGAIQLAFVLLLTALALYLLTMYSYDSLLMPPRFWAEGPQRGPEESSRWPFVDRVVRRRTRGAWLPRRPPSSSAWVVFRNMQRTWNWLFTPANVLVALAFVVLAGALLRLEGWIWLPVVLFALVVVAWAWWFRPVLGSED